MGSYAGFDCVRIGKHGIVRNDVYNFVLEKPWELQWLVQKITATLCISFFRAWQQISGLGAEKKLTPSYDYMEEMIHDFTPFIIIKHPINLSSGLPITFSEYSVKQHQKINKDDLLCPYQKQKKIDRSKEKSHTPIAYSMRFFGSNRYPDNYKEENHKINKYVLNLQAPTKCPSQYSL